MASDLDYAQIVRQIEKYKDLINEVNTQKKKINSEIKEVSRSLQFLEQKKKKANIDLLEDMLKNDKPPKPTRSRTAPEKMTRREANLKSGTRIQSAHLLEDSIRESIQSLPGN